MTGPTPDNPCCAEGARFRASRRSFLAGSSAAVGGIVASSVFGGAFREIAYASDAGDTIVILNMGGGVDGMSWVVPYGDPLYYAARPDIAVPADTLLATDGTFGLNPAMKPLLGMWQKGSVGLLHASGLSAPNRSHFDAAAEIGDADPGTSVRTGWVNRMIGLTGITNQFSAIGMSGGLPAAMSGPQPVTTMSGLTGSRIPGTSSSGSVADRRNQQLQTMWGSSTAPFAAAVRDAVTGSAAIAQLSSNSLSAATSAYSDSDLGRALRDTARLIKGGLGVRAVAVDYGAYDHHVNLGAVDGSFSKQLGDMATCVAAFFADLGDRADRVTLVTTSEFGRRLEQNSSGGLDHGWGNVMMAVGANVKGGYHASWPGLTTGDLESGDLRATTDYRYLLAEIVAKRIPEVSVGEVFPNLGRHQTTGMIA